MLIVEAARTDTISLSDAQGFTELSVSPLNNGAGTTASKLAVVWCRATSTSMAAPTLAAVTNHQAGIILTWRGCKATGNPWDAIATAVNNTTTTSPAAPAVTTTTPDCTIVSIISRGVATANGQFSAWGNSATERFDAGTATGNGGGVGVADYAYAGPGTTGTTGATLNNSSIYCAYTIALAPAAVVVSGAASITLDDLITASAAALQAKGSASITLDDLSTTATAALQAKGPASITLDDLTATSTAAAPVAGAASITLDDLTASSTAASTISGAASITLEDLVATAAGTVGYELMCSLALRVPVVTL